MSATNSKRIAKNTLFLYVRMILIMLITLYTSRVVLAELGVEDYGVYMVVGGVVSMFGFLKSCMTSSTQRYLNFELGTENTERLKDVFSTSLLIHILIALIFLILAETIGLWFINNKLIIPDNSMYAANVVYQSAVLSFFVSIIYVPFNAAIIAHEKMQVFAYISILEAALKLLIAYLLVIVTSQKLAVYGLLVLAVQVVVALIYVVISVLNFKECRFRIKFIGPLFNEMSKFAGWNMFGSLAWLARGQGMSIVLNMFFGPALNAAKGIADQVSGAVNNLNGNFQIALNPQITKNYASGSKKEMELLTYRGIKFSSIILWMMALPIILNSSTILSIWLKEVPDYANYFIILVLFDLLSGNFFGTPLMTSLSATGNIKKYQIVVSTELLLIIPTAYFALKYGCPPEIVFYLNILFNIISGVTRFWFCKVQLGYSVRHFVRYVLFPVLTVYILSAIIPTLLAIYVFNDMSVWSFILHVIISTICIGIFTWLLGFEKDERHVITSIIKNKLHFNGKDL